MDAGGAARAWEVGERMGCMAQLPRDDAPGMQSSPVVMPVPVSECEAQAGTVMRPAPWEDLPEPVAVVASAPSDADTVPEDGEDEPVVQDDLSAYAWMENFELEEVGEVPGGAQVPVLALAPATGLAAEWLALFPRLGLSGMTASIASNTTLVVRDGVRWVLHLDPAQSALFNPSQQRRLAAAISQYLQQDIELQVDVVVPEQETPAQAAARQRAERLQGAAASLQADPLVQQMVSEFAAVICDETIEPLEIAGEKS